MESKYNVFTQQTSTFILTKAVARTSHTSNDEFGRSSSSQASTLSPNYNIKNMVPSNIELLREMVSSNTYRHANNYKTCALTIMRAFYGRIVDRISGNTFTVHEHTYAETKLYEYMADLIIVVNLISKGISPDHALRCVVENRAQNPMTDDDLKAMLTELNGAEIVYQTLVSLNCDRFNKY